MVVIADLGKSFTVSPVIQSLGRALPAMRQQVVATAIVFFKRFYTKNAFRLCDPLLLVPTCMYLACKVEEFTQPIATLIDKMKLVSMEPLHSFLSTSGDARPGPPFLLKPKKLPWKSLDTPARIFWSASFSSSRSWTALCWFTIHTDRWDCKHRCFDFPLFSPPVISGYFFSQALLRRAGPRVPIACMVPFLPSMRGF